MKNVLLCLFICSSINLFAQQSDTLNLVGSNKTINKNYVIVYEMQPQKYYEKCFDRIFNQEEKDLLKLYGLIDFHLLIDIDSGEIIELFTPNNNIEEELLSKIHRIFINEIKFKIHKVVSNEEDGKYLYIITTVDLRKLKEDKN